MLSALLVAASLAFTPKDASFALQTAREFVRACPRRDAGSVGGGVAANWILDHASMTGADVRRDSFLAPTPRGDRHFVNLYSEFAADATSRWVVVVSHFDTKPGAECPGANDGASTSALLIALANILADRREPHGNVLLVWTDGEECMGLGYGPNDGLQGARRTVAWLKERDVPIQAVICLDMLGDRDLSITIPANGSPALAKIAMLAAKRIGEPDLVRTVPEIVKDDHVPFVEAGMKAVDLIDFSYGPDNSWWHTREDTVDKLSEASLLKAGRLVCEMLTILL